MERFKFYDISHRDHVVMNPLTVEKLDELIRLLHLAAGSLVLDVGSGKGEFLFRLAERTRVEALGVDLSPYCVEQARERGRRRRLMGQVAFALEDGAALPVPNPRYDLAACLGATFIFGGYRQTLERLLQLAAPGGLIVVGEPFWRKTPPPAYPEQAALGADAFLTHAGNVNAGLELGLTLLYTLAASHDDFDRYEALQWQAAERYAREHPEDPDVPELLSRQHEARDAYLQHGREALGWSLYLFQTPR
jgi:SAM-dependent methyltransferase